MHYWKYKSIFKNKSLLGARGCVTFFSSRIWFCSYSYAMMHFIFSMQKPNILNKISRADQVARDTSSKTLTELTPGGERCKLLGYTYKLLH